MRVDGALGYEMTRAILTRYGVRFPDEAIVASEAEALAAARALGYPVAVKTLAPGVLHKTEAGGVVLDVRDPAALRAAWRTLSEPVGPGAVLVQAMVAPGIELLVGGRRDPVFGPVVALAPGGLFAELIRDVSVRLAPLGAEEARAMLAEGRKGVLLRGFRGRPPCDEAVLAAVVTGVGDLLADHPAVVELDLNPVIATGDQVIAVDALLIVRSEAGG
jgi:hypothetical protein